MSELARRVLFSVIAAPLAIWIVIAGGAPLAALLAVVAALGAWEYFRIARAAGLTPLGDAGVALAGLVPLAVHARYLGLFEIPVSLVALIVLALLAATIWTRGVEGKPVGAAASTILGVVYTGGMLAFGYAIRYHPYAFGAASLWGITIPSGALLLLLPLLSTWVSDIGAFFIGRAIGGPKLIPSVSPGKTIAGAVGGLLVTVLFAWAYAHWILHPSSQLGFRRWSVLLFGAAISAVAQIGDLFESLIKRDANVKDSSHIIPGHGGVLDRFDSLLFVLPTAYVLFGWLLVWAP